MKSRRVQILGGIYLAAMVAMLSSMNLSGAQNFLYELPQESEGVRLITPAFPEFQTELQKLVDVTQINGISRVLPYSVIFKNESRQAVIAFVIRYRIKNDTGQPVWHTQRIRAAGRDDRFLLGYGAVFFVSPAKQLNPAITHRRLGTIPAEAIAARVEQAIALYERQTEVRISLDSVVFQDGRFIGPDTANAFSHYAGEFRAETAFRAALNSLRGEALRQYLSDVSGLPDSGSKVSEMTELQHYENRLRDLGAGLLSVLGSRSEEQMRTDANLYLPVFPRVYRK